jgi:dTDP-4-amino-4,6-dideoxygalactose transaminase
MALPFNLHAEVFAMLPFIDLKAQYKRLQSQISQRVNAVLEHGIFIMGPEVRELEQELAAYLGVKHLISCSSGSDALLMSLMAWGIKPGDAVFVPVFTFFATAEMVSLLGATPVFVDVDPVSFNMDAAALEKAITALERQDPSIYPLPANYRDLIPRALIAVDLFGIAADYAKLLPLARARNLLVLEDAAQSLGAKVSDKMAGGLGCDAAALSFFPAKTLGAYGDGGAIACDDDHLAQILQSIRVHGQGRNKYENLRIGLNGRLDTLQAAILLPKLAILEDELAMRQRVAQIYGDGFAAKAAITAPKAPPAQRPAWSQYSLLLPNRDKTAAALGRAGIPSNIYYPQPLHMQKAYAGLGYAPDSFPAASEVSAHILALPMHPYLPVADQSMIIKVVEENL